MQPIFKEKKTSTQDIRIAARIIRCRRLHNQWGAGGRGVDVGASTF